MIYPGDSPCALEKIVYCADLKWNVLLYIYMSYNVLLYILYKIFYMCSYVGHIYIYNCYTFFLDKSLDYIMTSFVSCYSFCFKVYFFLDISIPVPTFVCFIFAWDTFSPPLFSVVCVFISKASLL